MRQLRKRKFKGATLQRRQAVYGYIFTIPLILGIVFLFLPEMVNTLVYSISDVNHGGQRCDADRLCPLLQRAV